MFFRKLMSLLVLTVVFGSLLGFSVGVSASAAIPSLSITYEGTKAAPPTPSPEEPHQILPVSILVYTQYADVTGTVNNEFYNTMGAINDTYGTDYYYTNLTDYMQLASALPGHDILLIPEQENNDTAGLTAIGTAWASTLTDFVTNGGIVILMAAYDGEDGVTSHIYNASGIMQITSINTGSFGFTVNLVNSSDALARGVASSWSAADGSVTFETAEHTSVVEDVGGDSLVVHKMIGQGHAVLLGFDLWEREVNYDQLLGNAIRLHRHVVFDESHNQYNTILADFSDFADDLVTEGFAVSRMGDFSPAFFAAADVLVLTTGDNQFYTSAEADAIEAFVQDGGGLFVATDYGSFGEELDEVTDRFGFTRNKTNGYLTDTDDTIAGDSYNVYDGANIANHSITLGVTRLELDRPGGFIDLPSNAVTLVTTDTDGTSDWNDGTAADGVPVAATVTTVGDGRVAVVGDMNFMDDSTNPDADGDTTYSDSDNDVFLINNVRWLSAAGLKERIVLFDNSHTPISSYDVNNHYLELGNYLTSNGYTVHWMSTFYTTLLDEAHVLVVVEGNTAHTNAEIAAIVAFVAAGGGLFLMADWGGFGDNVDVIGNKFGIDRNDTSYLDDSDDWLVGTSYIIYEDSNMGNHPIMEGISRIEVDRGTAFDTVGSGTVLMASDNDDTCTWNDGGIANNIAVFAATEHELGRVVYITDMNFFSGFDDPDIDGVPDFYEADNNLFAVNAFQWLAENRAPVVEVTAPNGGEEFSGTTSITWTATDPNKDEFTIDISYSTNGGSSWTNIASGLPNNGSISWDTSSAPDSDQYLIRVEATDHELTGQDDSDAVFQVDNNGPTIANVKHGPAAPTAADTVNVSADVEDISGVKSVTCYYTVNSGTEQSVAMSNVAGTLYAVDFPTNFAVNDVVEYYIKAKDNNDFESTSSTKSFTVAAPPGIPGFELPVVTLGLLVSLGILFMVRRKRR